MPRHRGGRFEVPDTELFGLPRWRSDEHFPALGKEARPPRAGKCTIQIKHFGNAAARLSLSHLTKKPGVKRHPELRGQFSMARDSRAMPRSSLPRGRAGDYIFITNAGVSGAAEASICRLSKRPVCSVVACLEATGSRPSFGAARPRGC